MDSSERSTKKLLSQEISVLADVLQRDLTSNAPTLPPDLLHLKRLASSGALSYWLCNFLDIVHARWDVACQEEALTARAYAESSRSSRPRVMLALMSSLNSASQDSDWNRQIFTDIHSYRQEVGELQKDLVKVRSKDLQPSDEISPTNQVRSSRRQRSKICVSRTYLPRFAELLLALSLGSLPMRWREPHIESKSIDEDLRMKLDFRPEAAFPGSFEHFIRSYLSMHLPMSLVEDFAEIRSVVSDKTKRTPHAFFTAHLHVSSDSFLIWCEMQRERGMRLVLSQHGGLNGQGLVPTRGEEFEAKFADRYLHWGWAKVPTAIRIPAQLNVWARKRRRSNHLNKLVIITDCTYRWSRRPWASTDDNARYRRMLLEIYGSLEDEVRTNTIIRLHHDHDKYDESHETMWRSEFPNVKLDGGLSSIWPLRRQAKLLVCTSLGTSEIEQFARSMPTVLRLDPEVHALRSSCVSLFEEMESGGLVHWSTDSFERFIRENWDDVDQWWRSRDTQDLVMKYLSMYGHSTRKPLRRFRQTLLEASNSY